MTTCVFCNIKEDIILESDNCIVVLDKNPVVKGHLLVITKKHFVSLVDIPDDVMLDIMKTIKKMEKRLIEKLKVGIDLKQHYRPFLKEGELVKKHIHFHLIPRSFEDDIHKSTRYSKRISFSKEDKEELIKLLS